MLKKYSLKILQIGTISRINKHLLYKGNIEMSLESVLRQDVGYSSNQSHFTADGNAGWIEHTDGSLQYIPKSPAYLFGELVLRPAIDNGLYYSSRLISIVSSGLSYLDQRVSSLFPSFPGAAASGVSGVVFCPSSDKPTTIDFEEYAKGLDIEAQVTLQKNPRFTENYKKALEVKADLKVFIHQISESYRSISTSITTYSQSYKLLSEKMNAITTDVQAKGPDSSYHPYQNKKITLIFPKLYANKINEDLNVSLAIKLGKLEENGESLLKKIPEKSGDENITESLLDLKRQIWKKIHTGGDFDLNMFFITRGTQPYIFAQLFSDEKFSAMKNFIEIKKAEILTQVKHDQQKFLKEILDDKNKATHDIIEARIQAMYVEHRSLITDNNKHGDTHYDIKISKEGDRIVGWQTIQEWRWTNEKNFEFLIRETDGIKRKGPQKKRRRVLVSRASSL